MPLARGRCQSEEEAPRDGVVRLNFGAKPFDSRASSPLCERSEELTREAAMLPFVGHQDRIQPLGSILRKIPYEAPNFTRTEEQLIKRLLKTARPSGEEER